MREAQRRLALTAWRELFALAESKIEAEERYFSLLRRADAMERADLIGSDEWRKLVQQAGSSFSQGAECMLDAAKGKGVR